MGEDKLWVLYRGCWFGCCLYLSSMLYCSHHGSHSSPFGGGVSEGGGETVRMPWSGTGDDRSGVISRSLNDDRCELVSGRVG